MLFLPYRLGLHVRKSLVANVWVTAVLLALLLMLVSAAVAMDGFPYPGVAVLVTLAGFFWSAAGVVFCLVALYPAARGRHLRLWGIAMGLNLVSLYVFFSLAAMY